MQPINYSFQSLEVWKKAREIRSSISQIADEFPAKERFRLTDQIIRSSRSVNANIAEGYGRFSNKDSCHFFRMARGSMYETMDHLTVALDEKYIQQAVFDNLEKEMFLFMKLINGYIKYQESLSTSRSTEINQPANKPTNQ